MASMACLDTLDLTTEENLLSGIRQLESALDMETENGRGTAWAEQMKSALECLERLMKDHDSHWNASDGPFQAIDMTRPTVLRKLSHLRESFSAALLRAIWLRQKFERLTLSLVEGDSSFVVYGVKEQGHGLLRSLHDYSDNESKLVLDSNHTDIGAGD